EPVELAEGDGLAHVVEGRTVAVLRAGLVEEIAQGLVALPVDLGGNALGITLQPDTIHAFPLVGTAAAGRATHSSRARTFSPRAARRARPRQWRRSPRSTRPSSTPRRLRRAQRRRRRARACRRRSR